jgi:hypothetical protein
MGKHSIFKLFKAANKIDIYDLNYLYGSVKLSRLSWAPEFALTHKGIIKRIVIFFGRFAQYLSYGWNHVVPKTHNFFFAMTYNQDFSLRPVIQKMEVHDYFGLFGQGEKKYPMLRAYFISFLYFPKVLLNYFRSKDYQRYSYKYSFDLYWLIYGYYISNRIFFRKHKYQTLILSNDHIMLTRTLIKSANDEGVVTIYLQHAAVTNKFPSLINTYAFLDGMDSLSKYDECGKQDTIVFLTGSPKQDKVFDFVNKRSGIKSVGFCNGINDKVEDVLEWIKCLTGTFPEVEFIIRPHPADKRISQWAKITEEYSLRYSNAKQEVSSDFLKTVDLIISSSSTILLEAVMMNVVPVQVDYSGKEVNDYYGFIKNAVVGLYGSEASAIASEIDKIKNSRPDIRHRAKYYFDTVGTKYDGKSSDLVKMLIEQINSTGIDLSCWERIENVSNLVAYKLKNA